MVSSCNNHEIYSSLVREIISLCHFRKKNDLMPVIICKNDKNFVTFYNVKFFKYDRHPVIFDLYVLLTQEGSNVPMK